MTAAASAATPATGRRISSGWPPSFWERIPQSRPSRLTFHSIERSLLYEGKTGCSFCPWDTVLRQRRAGGNRADDRGYHGQRRRRRDCAGVSGDRADRHGGDYHPLHRAGRHRCAHQGGRSQFPDGLPAGETQQLRV